MSASIKYFENGAKNMPLFIKDDEVWEKYDKPWDMIKNNLGIKLHRQPVCQYKYLKVKVKEFECVIKRNFWGIDMAKKYVLYLYCLHNY